MTLQYRASLPKVKIQGRGHQHNLKLPFSPSKPPSSQRPPQITVSSTAYPNNNTTVEGIPLTPSPAPMAAASEPQPTTFCLW